MRIGTVISVNLSARTARVRFGDLKMPSGDLPVMRTPPLVQIAPGGQEEVHGHGVSVSPWMPQVGDTVVCLYKENSKGAGVIIGGL
ncbi:MAG: hypothetical protein FWE08_06210 [Oscillospiraceae bacterium]|nr:hypothetical protein [Oscillospiraceae bacterium]